MDGKDLIFKTMNHKKTNKIPWVPFTGIHVGKLKGYSAIEILKSKEKLVESLLESNKIYKPDGQPVIFDLQIEAEILNCKLKWLNNSPPIVVEHPYERSKDILKKIPKKSEGRLPIVLEAMKEMKEEIGEETALFGLICGPFTLASHLRGTQLYMDMVLDPEYVLRLIEYTTEVALTMAKYYINAGMDIIAAVDPMVSQISPDHFNEFLRKPYSKLFDFIRDLNKFSSFFVCGDATKNIQPMCKTGPDSLFVDENVNLIEAKKISDEYNIIIGGNIPLTTVMLHGNQEDNMKYVIDLIDRVDSKNLIISPGCDMPYDIPKENVISIEQAIHQTEKYREIIKNYEKVEENIRIELPDYSNLNKPLIEVFTLNSDTCAACTYMLSAAEDFKVKYEDNVEVKEYKFNNKKSIARMQKLNVEKLPSIYVNGELKFSSKVPNYIELKEAVQLKSN
ncbi:MAG: uroporphyrinogen decarboxylase family protein [bacterium]